MAREALAVPNWHTGATLAVHRQTTGEHLVVDGR
ncbi:hypothetical protein L914_21574 [Phytophthora nicotianae]|uniref:Uncharacterized protein n=1 Tax=Phytophthora nicotianae TaxID=4792 RepID=W2M311_PHYNI|nr:hypothetical protein L914_21574 [Phytophthora nicotianae]